MWEFVVKYWVEFAFGLVAAGLIGAYKHLYKKVKDNRSMEKAVAEGVKYLLMFQLREEGERYLKDKKCSIEDKREYEMVYDAYHALGGNNAITTLRDQVLNLPV